ncbi:MAG: hypothetical protein ACRDYC_09455 [Acidimicrobiales bacterium]
MSLISPAWLALLAVALLGGAALASWARRAQKEVEALKRAAREVRVITPLAREIAARRLGGNPN